MSHSCYTFSCSTLSPACTGFVHARDLYSDLNILKIIRKGMEQRNSYFSSLIGASSMLLFCHFVIPDTMLICEF